MISFPLDAIVLVPLYKQVASYKETEAAIGTLTNVKIILQHYFENWLTALDQLFTVENLIR